jgi:heme/copper-type cytochrome/quinol oxidase subunit 2
MSETSAVPAQADSAAPNPAGPGAEIAGTSHKAVAALIVIFLVVAGILAVFLWQRSHIDRQGSLITRALNKDKENPPPSL